MTNPRIVLLEDDHWQEETIVDTINGVSDLPVEVIRTEHAFMRQLPYFQADPPSAFVLDMLVRYADPEPDAPEPPADHGSTGYFTAGLRCLRSLRGHRSTRDVPIVVYTVLDELDARRSMDSSEADVAVFTKTQDDRPIADWLRAAVAGCEATGRLSHR